MFHTSMTQLIERLQNTSTTIPRNQNLRLCLCVKVRAFTSLGQRELLSRLIRIELILGLAEVTCQSMNFWINTLPLNFKKLTGQNQLGNLERSMLFKRPLVTNNNEKSLQFLEGVCIHLGLGHK